MLDAARRPVARYRFFEGWPKKVSVELDRETGLAVEGITITVERIVRE